MDRPIHPLSMPGICASARAAAERGIPHDEANHFNKDSEHEDFLHAAFKGAYEGYIGAAFTGAFSVHEKSRVEVAKDSILFFCPQVGIPNGSQQLGASANE